MSGSRRFPAWSAPRGLLGMLALVASAEAFIAGHDLRFSRLEPDDWRDAAQTACTAVPAGGVLILGDSQAKFGISPLQVEAALGQPVQSLAVQGGQAPSSYFLLKKALDAGMIPSAVVVSFEPHLLRDGPKDKTRMWAELADLGECFELARTTNSPEEFGAMAVARILPSYRERFEVRANLMAAFRGETPTGPAMIEMARRNRGMNRGALMMSKDLGDHNHDISAWGNPTPEPWAPNPANDRYVRRLLRLALDRKIPVYLPLLPLTPGVQTKYEQAGLDARYIAWVGKLMERFPNLHVLDWRHAEYGPLAFFDALHLNATGASAVGATLGDHLARVARGGQPDQRWVTMPKYRPDVAAIAVEDSFQSDAANRARATVRR